MSDAGRERPSERQAHMLKHALGINQSGREFRNHFCADDTGPDFEAWQEMVALGWATSRPYKLAPDMVIFRVTPTGRSALTDGGE